MLTQGKSPGLKGLIEALVALDNAMTGPRATSRKYAKSVAARRAQAIISFNTILAAVKRPPLKGESDAWQTMNEPLRTALSKFQTALDSRWADEGVDCSESREVGYKFIARFEDVLEATKANYGKWASDARSSFLLSLPRALVYPYARSPSIAKISPLQSVTLKRISNIKFQCYSDPVATIAKIAEAQRVLSAAFAERKKGKNKSRVLELACHKETGALSFNGSIEAVMERAVEVVAKEVEESLRSRWKSLLDDSVKQIADMNVLASQESNDSFENMRRLEAQNMAPFVALGGAAMELAADLSHPPGSGDAL